MKFIEGNVNWGIIGCGDVCEVKSGPAFEKTEHSKLVAVMRRDKLKAEDFARRHGVPNFYDDADRLIEDERVNAVYVATPPAFHEEYAFRSMKAGKPVYIEKPVSVNSASCQRMIVASEQFDVPAVCAHYRRALSLFKEVRTIVQEGRIGPVRIIDLHLLQTPPGSIIKSDDNWRIDPAISGGGLFHDLAPHQLDIIYWIFGKPLEMNGRSLNQSKANASPDVTNLEAIFDNDVLFHGLWAFNVNPAAEHDSCSIMGDLGFISFPFFKDPLLDMYTGEDSQQKKFTAPKHIQQPMIESVVRYFRGEGENPCSLGEALVTMEMIDCAN
jgi:predicted dehydrogenase